MPKYIKNNILIVSIMLLLGLFSFSGLSYFERRIFGIFISLIELIVVLILAKRENMSMHNLGLKKPIKPIAWIVGIFISLMPMFLMIVLNKGNISMMFPQKTSLMICILQTIYYFVIVAPIEEIIFRGFVLENFNKKHSENMSVLLTSFIFAIIHIYNASLMNMVLAFIISVLYCKVKLSPNNHSLFPCMVGHAINDSLNQWIPYFWL